MEMQAAAINQKWWRDHKLRRSKRAKRPRLKQKREEAQADETQHETLDAVAQAEHPVESAGIHAMPLTCPCILDRGDDLEETLYRERGASGTEMPE